MKNIKLILQYDGTLYHGFQIQPDVITIQSVLENCVEEITGVKTRVNGCSRTDAGVHAVKYCAGFVTESPIPAEKFSVVMNNYLPPDIRIISSSQEDEDFHPRFSTKSKEYVYTINTNPQTDVFSRNYEWQLKTKLNAKLMNKAAKNIIGEHDFCSFMTSGPELESTVRNVMSLNVIEEGGKIKIYIRADGFLYNMVRIITGTLVWVGEGRIKPEDVIGIIEKKDRSFAGPTAPPQGLALNEIFY
ncbi:MAG: tRNA pseudouridine(38-40) synthase TruA [Clostridia bacterium]|nr:tRNA pseudouridine(38-40) synthase TruA [Clostridia bacterium]